MPILLPLSSWWVLISGLARIRCSPFARVDDAMTGFGAAQLGSYRPFAAPHGKLNVAGEQRAHRAGAAAAEKDNLDVDPVFLEHSLLFGNPDTAVGRSYGAMAEPDFFLGAQGG
jgi:hypothetical protein